LKKNPLSMCRCILKGRIHQWTRCYIIMWIARVKRQEGFATSSLLVLYLSKHYIIIVVSRS
jgi:hypothetical protein